MAVEEYDGDSAGEDDEVDDITEEEGGQGDTESSGQPPTTDRTILQIRLKALLIHWRYYRARYYHYISHLTRLFYEDGVSDAILYHLKDHQVSNGIYSSFLLL
jgi:hypothetical protein